MIDLSISFLLNCIRHKNFFIQAFKLCNFFDQIPWYTVIMIRKFLISTPIHKNYNNWISKISAAKYKLQWWHSFYRSFYGLKFFIFSSFFDFHDILSIILHYTQIKFIDKKFENNYKNYLINYIIFKNLAKQNAVIKLVKI